MPQYPVDDNFDYSVGKEFRLDGANFHHIINVRRHKNGDLIVLRPKDGSFISGELVSVQKESCIICVTGIKPAVQNYLKLTLAMPVLKGKSNDFVIEKCVESGVTGIIPVFYNRCVPESSSINKKRERWQRIIEETFKQCMAPVMPLLMPSISSKELFVTKDITCLIADVHAGDRLDAKLFTDEIIVSIGPEGGFDESEKTQAAHNGWKSFRLSANQLKAETACFVIPAVIRELSLFS
ncbi:MAG: 16S rRNA (uracil(1498)-N(3))-methyltransferase [Spirochaetes bacterium]|nr:16S rRNA (uracil(1498)-N(3))-methyltransferase [Spirochaetota bacterium]MBN2770788.1 16S rRNA (uracil(1498)-N(3))-methyltransferase [Spirochaetota bacterium]